MIHSTTDALAEIERRHDVLRRIESFAIIIIALISVSVIVVNIAILDKVRTLTNGLESCTTVEGECYKNAKAIADARVRHAVDISTDRVACMLQILPTERTTSDIEACKDQFK